MEREMEKEKNMIMVNQYLKVNILMGIGMEKEKNIGMEFQFLKVNIYMDIGMEKEKIMMIMEN